MGYAPDPVTKKKKEKGKKSGRFLSLFSLPRLWEEMWVQTDKPEIV
jgi:hypothetical protein